ncbi:MAG: response regulator transcription factor [Kiritimatiellia bacterium]
MQTIFVVEDDPAVARGLLSGLKEEGYEVVHVATAAQARKKIREVGPAAVLLDLGLPDEDGMGLLQCFREENPQLPVLILTARNEVEERVSGLDRGAVDYILKPFALPELLARIRMHLRRSGVADAAVLPCANLKADLLAHRLTCDGRMIELPPREFDLLVCLMRSAGKPVSREQISREVWNSPQRMSSLDNLIDVHISRLRERLSDAGSGAVLRTVRGVGYTLEKGEAE